LSSRTQSTLDANSYSSASAGEHAPARPSRRPRHQVSTAARAVADELHARELWPQLEALGAPSAAWPLDRLSTWADTTLAHLGPPTRSAVISGPTRRALRYVDEALDGIPRLQRAAAAAGPSPSRLSHLFRAEIGLPFRSFVLWARLRRAAELAAGGASTTECAIAAGFSDAAHFSRTFREHFGLPPSLVLPLIEPRWPATS